MKTRLTEIDFIKGIAIIFVILLHTLPEKALCISYACLHIWQAVPLFLFISFYLSFRGLEYHKDGNLMAYYYSYKRIKRIIKEIAIPFFVVVAIEVVLRVLTQEKEFGISDLCHGWLGVGPGSYYFWIYIQLWIFIPVLYIILKKMHWLGMIIILALCIILNLICEYIAISPELYRILFVRYFFLSVPAFILMDREMLGKKKLSVLIIMGILVSFVYLVYPNNYFLSSYVLSLGWGYQQWPAYFWTYLVYICLYFSSIQLKRTCFLNFVEFLGRNSWYVFLTQMFLLAYFDIRFIGFIQDDILRVIIYISIVMLFSIAPTYLIVRKNK